MTMMNYSRAARNTQNVRQFPSSSHPRWNHDDGTSLFFASGERSMQQLLRDVAKLAPADITVCLMGETGSGKEIVAREIHARSPRSGASFVGVNCATIPTELADTLLFGHVGGAFTGAAREGRAGLVYAAHGGTLFLDEISDLSLTCQAKVLRVIQEGTFYPVGATSPSRSDFRLIAASNRDLSCEVKEGRFRHDLAARLGEPLEIPPLRKRPNDLMVIAEIAVDKFSCGRKTLGPDACKALLNYAWPGNVREMLDKLQRAVLISDRDILSVECLRLRTSSPPPPVGDLPTAETPTRETPPPPPVQAQADEDLNLERKYVETVLKALAKHGGHRTRAAADLGIPFTTLYRRLKAFRKKGYEIP